MAYQPSFVPHFLFAMLLLILFVLGTCVGSFLNVCIWRLPRGESVVEPPSHCPRCNTRLQALDLVPLWSQVFLKRALPLLRQQHFVALLRHRVSHRRALRDGGAAPGNSDRRFAVGRGLGRAMPSTCCNCWSWCRAW
jgi:hypothetical protein